MPLRSGISHFEGLRARELKSIQPPLSVREEPIAVAVKDKGVLARLKLGKDEASDDWHTNVLIASRLSTVFVKTTPIKTVDPAQKKDDLRDITKEDKYE